MNIRTLFQNFIKFTYLPARMCRTSPKGIKYVGFTYYPRHENFKDPPYEPSKLFLVKRIKSVKGTIPLERNILRDLKLDGSKKDNGHINIVKNIPSINALLWKVKHLVEIKPITWKGELPKDDDCSGTHLRHTGELVISPRLKTTPDTVAFSENYQKNARQLTRCYLRKYLREKWINGYSGKI